MGCQSQPAKTPQGAKKDFFVKQLTRNNLVVYNSVTETKDLRYSKIQAALR
jgi:hypothetical protein